MFYEKKNNRIYRMPKYYCDYCDTFLTHDSPSVRKTHCNGRKHKEAVRMYYQTWMEEQAQKLIDATTAAYKAGKLNAPLPPFMMGMMGPPMGAVPPPGMMPAGMAPPPPMIGGPPMNMAGGPPPPMGIGMPGMMNFGPPGGMPMMPGMPGNMMRPPMGNMMGGPMMNSMNMMR